MADAQPTQMEQRMKLSQGVTGFLSAIIERTPNGEWIAVQFHPDDDWSVAHEPLTRPTVDLGEDGELVGRAIVTELERQGVAYGGIDLAALASVMAGRIAELEDANEKLGDWMSAAFNDPAVGSAMKLDIEAWFKARAALAPKARHE